jgi:anti-sigma regulatory factor (Ser/Thr protein kinase)
MGDVLSPTRPRLEALMRESAAVLAPQFEHAAVFYHSTDEYLDAVLGFVAAGLEHANPVLVAVPGPKIGLLREHLDGADRVSFADMTELGANPARIIPEVAAFADAHRGRSVRYVGEPIWAARTAAELCEATRHEALINLAFAGTAASILCPYDRARLAPGVIADAERTHPVLIQNGLALPSRAYPEAGLFPPGCDQPLPRPPGGAAALTYRHDLARVRAFATEHAGRAGLPADRTRDLVIAVSELAANTWRHTDATGTLHIWTADGELLCQFHDSGQIRDPLAGRRRAAPGAVNGHGLWVVHQLCDLVELRTGSTGTTIRLHFRLRS